MSTKNEVTKDDVFTLSTGVTVRFKAVPALILSELTQRTKRPTPPKFFNEDLGREEENPNDPAYLSAVQDWDASITSGMINTMILFGVEIVDTPKKIPGIDDKDWITKLSILNINIGETKQEKRLAWMKYIAAPSADDIQQMITEIGKKSGVSEEDVDTASEIFRDKDE